MSLGESLNRMKELMGPSRLDTPLKANVSETVEKKIEGPDGKTYGIVRENQRFYIKESKDGSSFDYIGGFANKSEYEYPSYNSASRNLELKIRSINESMDNGKTFQTFKPVEQAEYIVEATSEMRNELERVKQVMAGASKIMNESKTEFISKPTFKDPEGFGTATDPKKQGEPFEEPAKANLDKDPKTSTLKPQEAGAPFEDKAKAELEKDKNFKAGIPAKQGEPFDEPAKDVLGNAVVTKKPSGGKTIKVTEQQLADVKKKMNEAYFDIDDDFGAGYGDEDENPLLSKFDYPEINRMGKSFKPTAVELEDLPSDEEEPEYDGPMTDFDTDTVELGTEVGDLDNEDELELENEEYMLGEGFFDKFKAMGNVGKSLGGSAIDKGKEFGQKVADKGKQIAQNVSDKVGQVKTQASQAYNQSMAQSSQGQIDKIADMLKNELINLNSRTVKSGGQPLNYNSVLSSLSNKLRGQLRNVQSEEEIGGDDNEDLINEITEAVLNAFGQHPGYRKVPFTTPPADGNKPFGEKIGDSAPFTQPVKTSDKKIAKGDSKMNGETQQSLPKLGQKGDIKPFDKAPKGKEGDSAPKTTPTLGKKGDIKPFDKKVSKADALDKLSESIIADLKSLKKK